MAVVKLDKKEKIGAENYTNKILKNTPIGKYLYKMRAKDIESLRIKFIGVYYLAKREIPIADFPNFITLNKKNNVKNVGKSCY